MMKRLLSLALCLMMVFSLLPTAAFASVTAGQAIKYSVTGSETAIGMHNPSYNYAMRATVSLSQGKLSGITVQYILRNNPSSTWQNWENYSNTSTNRDIYNSAVAIANSIYQEYRDQVLTKTVIDEIYSKRANYSDFRDQCVVTAIYNALQKFTGTNYYMVTWYDTDGTTVLHEAMVFEGDTAYYPNNLSTPTKSAAEDGTTYQFIGWGESLDATETVSTTSVHSALQLYPLFRAVDPAAPIENEGMYMAKTAKVESDGTVSLAMEAYAHGRSGTALKAKDSEYVLLLDLNKQNNEGLAQFKAVTEGSWPAKYFNPGSSDFKNLFHYVESENRYARLFIYNCWQTKSQIESDFSDTQDQADVWYHSNKNTNGSVNTYEFTLAYKDKNGYNHLLRDTNYLGVDETPSDKNEHHYHGVYFTKNTGWGAGSGSFYICYPTFTFYNIDETADTSTTRLAALKAAVTSFLGQLKNNPQAKVQIIGFAGRQAFSNNNYTFVSTVKDYTNGLLSIETNYDTLVKAVDDLALLNTDGDITEEDRLYTYTSEALKAAAGTNWTTNARTVVLFQSHNPSKKSTSDSRYAHAWAQTDAADDAIYQASLLKKKNVNIYSIGLLAAGYEVAPLRQNNYGNTTKVAAYSDTYTLDHFFQGVSSNYGSGVTSLAGVKAANPTSDQYTVYAQSAVEFGNAFNYVIEHTETSDSTLNANTILKDFVTADFDTANATVKIYTQDKDTAADTWKRKVDVTPATISAAAVTNDNTGIKASLSGQTITVTGYDFAKNFVLDSEAKGQKLIVEVTGLVPLAIGEKIPTNEANSGLYVPNVSDPKVIFPRPTVTITDGPITKVIDFAAKTIVARGAEQLKGDTHHNGKFAMPSGGGNVTYQLDTEKQANKTATINHAYTKADKALIKAPFGGENAVWKSVTVVPASSVYYDDSFGDSVTIDPDNVTIAANVAKATIDQTGIYQLTFYGTGIDVCCTTHSGGGYVTALMYQGAEGGTRLDKVEGFESIKPMTIKNQSTPNSYYNTPTISFRGLPADTYTLKLNALKSSDYRLDGVRIYNPVQAETDAADVLAETTEADAQYVSLRKALVNHDATYTVAKDLSAYTIKKDEDGVVRYYDSEGTEVALRGVLFIDNVNSLQTTKKNAQGEDEACYENLFDAYEVNGPKNEIYLSEGQAITFSVGNTTGKLFWIGMSAPVDGSGSVTINGAATPEPVKSYVEMYYPITPVNGSVTIANAGENLVSLTNLKITTAPSTEGATAVGHAAGFSFEPLTLKTVRMAANGGVDPEQIVTDDPGDASDPTPETKPDPAPDEKPTAPSISSFVQHFFSFFVQSLFRSISRLFGK